MKNMNNDDKKMLKSAAGIALLVVMLSATVVSANAFEWKFWKSKNVQNQENIEYNVEIKNDEENSVNVKEALEIANKDKTVQETAKMFAGEVLCVSTEKRSLSFTADVDGRVYQVESTKCDYKVTTNEKFVEEAYEKFKEGEIVDVNEVRKNVKVSNKLKFMFMFRVSTHSLK